MYDNRVTTTLSILEVQVWLQIFGYYDGPLDGDPTNDAFKTDLKKFQSDYPQAGTADGIYGPKTESALLPLVEQARASEAWPNAEDDIPDPPADKPPPIEDVGQLRRWRLTRYWISDAAGGDIPMYDPQKNVLEHVSAASFASASLEGTIYGPDKSLLNVTGIWVDVDADTYQPVYDYADSQGWLPDKAGYAGIRISDGRVTQAFSFKRVATGPNGYPRWQKNIEGLPFKTIATDTGQMPKSDPAYKGKGGVIPAGTWVFVLELYGMDLPDGGVHDGWVQANDTGSAIYGAHLDLFIGHVSNRSIRIPNLGSLSNGYRCHIWFEGIEKLDIDYSYGL